MASKFYIILIAQFLSALADNALLFAAIALLSSIAVVGCLAMIFGMQPLYAYGIVGIGAAAYSPAKYGILTELLPSNLLVKANGWMEGSTVAAIVFGAILGGALANNNLQLALWVIAGLYLAAAVFNYFIPKLPIDHALEQKTLPFILKDFWHAFFALWKDPLGQVSLAVTTLFWGAGATLRLVVLAWAMITLEFDIEESTQLIATVAIGIAIGAVIASRYISLEHSVKVLPAGIMMGVLVIAMIFVTHWLPAAFLLLLIGALSGFFVVPLNALLQHRGHHLVGAGHSIAVQNFNEHIGILLMLGLYLLMVKANIHINTITIIFGTFIIISMSIINRVYRNVSVTNLHSS